MACHGFAQLKAASLTPSRPQSRCWSSSSNRLTRQPRDGAPRATAVARRQQQRRAAAVCSAAAAAAGTPDGGGEVVTAADTAHMRRALELARRAEGKTHPNPAVGCVIVDASGNMVGEGYHPRAGMPHAEVYALRAAGQAAAGATAYVTLEPCNHFGRTPPCSRALVAAGVARVVVGCTDPNPLVGGQGIATLRQAGITVAVGCQQDDCFQLNAEFMARMQAAAAAEAAAA